MEGAKEFGRKTTRRLASYGGAGGALAVALVMMLSPAASAAGHTYKPPYSGAVSSISNYVDQSGCGSASLSSPVNWSSTTGILTMSEKASGRNCGTQLAGVGGSSYASVEGSLGLAVPIKITTSTTHSIVVNWKVNAKLAQTLIPGTCTPPVNYSSSSYWYCEAFAETYFEVYGYFIDTTNNTYNYASNSVFVYNETENYTEFFFGSFYNGSGVFSYGTLGSESLLFNTTTLNRADSYALVVYVYASTYVDVYSYGATLSGASGSGSFTMAGGANKATLTSIVVT